LFEFLFKYTRADYARSELVYLGDWPAWLVYGIVVATVVGTSAALWMRRGDARWHQLAAVAALQFAMIGVVVWVLMQPTLATDRLRDGENAVALVLDTSASMQYGTPGSRLQMASESLSRVLGDDPPGIAVRHYELSGSGRSVESFLDSEAAGETTAIAGSLRDILEQARFNPIAAVVLASDGADTSGGLTADALAEIAAYGVPVHTIGVGLERIEDDIELVDVAVPQRALPGSTVPARITIRHDAAANATIKVYDGDELLQLAPAELRADTLTTTAWIDVELAEAGPHQLHFSVERDDAGENELRNNERATLVNVENQRYRVLYFEGEPRWEYKFMRRAVGPDEDLNVATLLRVSPNKFYRQGIDTPEQLEDGFPTTRAELFGYDALVIGSVEAALLSTGQQQLIRDFVSERGGSLLMLAGPAGLGNGGWGQSEIADVLPARLPPSSTDTFHRKKAGVVLMPQGAGSQMLKFDADADNNRDAWQSLPEVADYQVLGDLKPAARTLLKADTELGQVPLFVGQPFGRGNAWILATGGTWRWQMSMPLEDTKHETFWRQTLRALVADVPRNASLTASKARSGDRIALRAEFRDEAFNALDGISVATVASHEDGDSLTLPMPPTEEPGTFVTEFEPPLSGTWYFEAVAQRGDEPVAVTRSSLLFESGQSEHFGFRRNAGLLQRLSDATGGRYFEPGDVSALPDLLRYSSAGITETEYRSIWDAPVVLLILLFLKGGEWLVRRRWKTI
jgi:uncharacterized membrane protein